ncbi:MAG: LpqB family beta-propeller domain-containing protein [Jatrophihabitans sp.]
MIGRSRTRVGVLSALVSIVLAGCTGVPTSSAPRTVEPIDIAGAYSTQAEPPPGADPRTIVQRFLDANPLDPVDHATARQYLGPQARKDWSDKTATIISDKSVSTYEPKKPITVSGRVVGTLTAAGIFVPTLQGIGDGGLTQKFTYQIGLVGGEYRITGLTDGLVLTTDQFEQDYRQHAVYFFDTVHRFLVPDTRWSALDGIDLANWLLIQLASGPRAELRNVVATDTLPVQAGARRLTVTPGPPLAIEIPGASQLDAQSQQRLAAVVSATITDPTATDPIVLTDGGTPVRLPDSAGPAIVAGNVDAQFIPQPPAADVYYLRAGDIVGDGGQRLSGRLRQSPFYLSSIAVSSQNSGPAVTVAAVSGTGQSGQLLIGTQTAGYRRVSLKGELSRPAWAPESNEVWIGAGGKIYRVVVSGNVGTPSQVLVPAAAGGGRILALRLSPEGARIAIVIGSSNGAKQLFIGSVVRTAGQVRVDALQSVSPEGVQVLDVAWIGPQKIFAIGSIVGSGDPRIFESNVDGSFWTGRNIGSLPEPPDSVSVAVNQLAWVSANDTVWEQNGRGWSSPGSTAQTTGDKPVYLE